MSAVPKAEIHSKIVDALHSSVEWQGAIEDVPFSVRLKGLGSFSLYAFTLTAPPGGRPTGEYKVQLIVPTQARGERGSLDFAPGAFTVIVGWSEVDEVFVLWDAYAHQTFAYSQNLQVPGRAVWLARTEGLYTTERRLRGGRGIETVVVCRRDTLRTALSERRRLTAERLSGIAD